MSQFERNFNRIEISKEMTIGIKSLTETARTEIKTLEDLSYSGVKIFSPKPFKVGDDLNIQIHWYRERLNIIATLHRCEKVDQHYDLGLEFVTLSKQDLKHIHGILQEAQGH